MSTLLLDVSARKTYVVNRKWIIAFPQLNFVQEHVVTKWYQQMRHAAAIVVHG